MSGAVALVAIASLAGCASHLGCGVYARAETWRQPEMWDFAKSNPRARVMDVGTWGAHWPNAPAEWHGNHSLGWIRFEVAQGFNLQAGAGNHEVLILLPANMGLEERRQVVVSFLANATLASPDEANAWFDSQDKTAHHDATGRLLSGRIDAPAAIGELSSLGPWAAMPINVGEWQLVNGPWKIDVNLDKRDFDFGRSWSVDAGGFVQGPSLEPSLSEAERQANTTLELSAWHAPEPTYSQSGVHNDTACT